MYLAICGATQLTAVVCTFFRLCVVFWHGPIRPTEARETRRLPRVHHAHAHTTPLPLFSLTINPLTARGVYVTTKSMKKGSPVGYLLLFLLSGPLPTTLPHLLSTAVASEKEVCCVHDKQRRRVWKLLLVPQIQSHPHY